MSFHWNWAPHFGVGTAGTIEEPDPEGVCLVYVDITDSGEPVEGVRGWLMYVEGEQRQNAAGGSYSVSARFEATSDAQGRISWPSVTRGAKISVYVPAAGLYRRLTAPDLEEYEA